MNVPIKLLTVDDHAAVGNVLRTVFERSPHFTFLGHAHSGTTAIEMVRLMQPDMVLVDLQMHAMNGVATTKTLLSQFPGLRIVGFSDVRYQYEERQMLEAGAVSVISKNVSPRELVNGLLAARENTN